MRRLDVTDTADATDIDPGRQEPEKRRLIDLSKIGWQWFVLVFLAFIWGTSFILMKKGLQSYTHTQVAAFRLFFSFVFLLPFILKHFKKLGRGNLKSLLVVGVVGIGVPAFLFTLAQTRINSSLAGMLNAFTPLSTLITGTLFYRGAYGARRVWGILLGLVGALGLLFKGEAGVFDEFNVYALLIVIATLCYGISVNETKHFLEKLDGLTITSMAFLMVGPPAFIYLLFSDYSGAVASGPYLVNLGYIALLALFSSVVALVLFNTLIKYTNALFASSVTYIIPVFAIFWGLLDGERVSLVQLVWIVVVFSGVYLVNRK